jgi:hypothetical protein
MKFGIRTSHTRTVHRQTIRLRPIDTVTLNLAIDVLGSDLATDRDRAIANTAKRAGELAAEQLEYVQIVGEDER